MISILTVNACSTSHFTAGVPQQASCRTDREHESCCPSVIRDQLEDSTERLLRATNDSSTSKSIRRNALQELLKRFAHVGSRARSALEVLGQIDVIPTERVDAADAFAGPWPFEDHTPLGHTLLLLRVYWEGSTPSDGSFDAVVISVTGSVSQTELKKALQGERQNSLDDALIAGCTMITND